MDLLHIVSSICNSSSLKEALYKYAVSKSLLGDYKFVFASDSGPSLGFTTNKLFSSGAAVRGLFSSTNVVVIDSDTFNEMASGTATFHMDQSLSLDTQAVSYLRPHMHGKSHRLPSDMDEVFRFISKPNVQIDPMPYVFENLRNMGVDNREKPIREILNCYEILRTIDVDHLQSAGLVRSTLSEIELENSTDAHLNRMRSHRADAVFYGALVQRHRYLYAILLKMVDIKLSSPSSSIDEMTMKFLEFCDKELACMFGREAVLARAYFQRGQNLTFFGKIQKNKSDILDALDNMAWDLYHVRQLEETMTLNVSPSARYLLPALLTFDKRFIEVMDLYPLKSIAYRKDGGQILPFHAADLPSALASSDEQKQIIFQRFYSDHARSSRSSRLEKARDRLGETVETLKASVRKAACV